MSGDEEKRGFKREGGLQGSIEKRHDGMQGTLERVEKGLQGNLSERLIPNHAVPRKPLPPMPEAVPLPKPTKKSD